MDTSTVAINQASYITVSAAKASNSTAGQLSSLSGTISSKDSAASKLSISKSSSILEKFSTAKAKANSVAQSLKTADETMENVGNLVEEMKQVLESAVKNFPPFPNGSEERVRLLRSFRGLRTLIDKLTIPPDASENNEASNSLSEENINNGWEIKIVNSESTYVINSKELSAGSNGLDIPEINDNSTYEEIILAMDKLNDAKVSIDSKRAALAERVNNISLYDNLGIANTDQTDQNSAEIYTKIFSDVEAEEVSTEIKEKLFENEYKSITSSSGQIDQLWE